MGVKLPNAALFERGQANHVFKQEAPGRFRRIAVTVAVRGEQYSWVTAGLKPGDTVVGDGALLINAQLGDQEGNFSPCWNVLPAFPRPAACSSRS